MKVLVFKEDPQIYVAQMLEIDIASTGLTPQAAIEELQDCFSSTLFEHAFLGLKEVVFEKRPAPSIYWYLFESAKKGSLHIDPTPWVNQQLDDCRLHDKILTPDERRQAETQLRGDRQS